MSSSSQEANSVNEDPMVQQMNNLRGYIQQAREANMFDEVSMLESNLRMLEEEFKRQEEENVGSDEASNSNRPAFQVGNDTDIAELPTEWTV